MSDSEPIYRSGRVIAGRYRITSPLSQGGMGAVYLAQQVSLGRDVALKVILERDSDPELIKRFDVEARAVCQLKHPNIITYHDYGRDEDGRPFLVMEYLAGYPGTKLVYGERRPGLLDLVHVVTQVCSALHEAHAKGIIHRDLKWSNVMVCPQSHDPYFAKLIDFGIMKVATDGSSGDQRALTRTGMLLGTPEYMSPEAICGMPIDGRADQYSLAIMLWEALEGHRPFDAASHFELLRKQVQDEPPVFDASATLITTYPELGVAILRAMEKHPADRFDDILAFQQALKLAVGLVQRSGTSPARPAARRSNKSGAAATPSFEEERARASGMPPSRTKLPAAPLTGPRPVDTRVKTGRQDAEATAHKLHWAWLAAGFVLFLGLGFGTVAAVMAGADEPTAVETVAEAARPEHDVLPLPKLAPSEPPTPEGEPSRQAAEVGPTAASEAARTEAPDATAGTTPRSETHDVAARVDSEATSIASAADAAPHAAGKIPAGVAEENAPMPEPPESPVRDESAEARPVAPKAPTAPGRLFVQVDPWGDLMIDGRPTGRAPFDAELKPGMHTVTVTNTYFKGSYTFRIRVESGKRSARTVLLEQHLEKIE